jgi:hypothetical protein
MLMATGLLNKRLYDIERARSRNPQIKDPTSTLVDIEKTHILFMNAHFKPFAAIGYEYNSVQVQSGTARLDSEVLFSIPQFGDFFHDMVLHIRLGSVEAVGADYWTSPADNPPAPVANGFSDQLLRYVDYLGQRLIKKVKMTVNGNPLDEYSNDVMNFHQKFFVPVNKEVGWKRNVGQEVPKTGYVHVGNANGRYGRGTGVREKRQICDGPQTPKPTQGQVDMWIPLLFWFNKDPRLSIPSVSIPYGQRFIVVQFAAASDILQHLHASNPALDSPGTNPVPVPDIEVCQLYINNIFVNPEIHDIFIKRIGFSLIRVHREQSIRTSNSTANLLLNQLKWPTETLYVGLRPTDNVDTSNTKMLEDWHMYSEIQDSTVGACGIGDYPILLFLPTGATVATVDAAVSRTSACGQTLATIATITGEAAGTTVTVSILNEWFQYYGFPTLPSATVDADVDTAAEIAAIWPMPAQQIPTVEDDGNVMVSAGRGADCCELRYKTCVPTMDQLSIETHGVSIYRDIPGPFFNSYIPYNYGGTHIRTPDDCGAFMITFNLYPGSYNPSGYINISRAREFYLSYTSSNVGVTINNADLVVVAIALNFLLISDGSAILRYST